MTLGKVKRNGMETTVAEIGELMELEVGGVTEIVDEVIAAVAGIAAREVEGVSSLGTSSIRRMLAERVGAAEHRARGVAVEAGRREAILDIDLRIIYGHSIPEVVIKVRESVARRLLEICGLVAKEINIDVVGIDFPERTPGLVE